ncbi:MAG: hypothetical protein RRA92_08030 [Gemmatimonadota bacterium]|nr:hypothetical protein [Gemmatimonadota bacterium]
MSKDRYGGATSLEPALSDITSALKSGAFGNEAAIVNGVVLRVLGALGWPVFETRVVQPEFAVGRRRVDLALCEPIGKPAVFVEVKRPGQAENGEKQLFECAFHSAIRMVVLTDGQEWRFYLPGERGDYQERRVYLLDIVEREVAEAAERLMRYLAYDRVRSGEALDAARNDYRKTATRREMVRNLPIAWRELVDEQDELLIELAADKVENLCGYRPGPDDVAAFVSNKVTIAGGPLPPTAPPSVTPPPTGRSTGLQPPYFKLRGTVYQGTSARDVLTKVIERLCAEDASFPERMAARPKHGRKRR